MHTFWPEHYLVADIPEARVWTYGYEVDVLHVNTKANNQNTVFQHSQDLAVKLERDITNDVGHPSGVPE